MKSDCLESGLDIVPFSLVSAENWQVNAWYHFEKNLRLEAVPDEPVFQKEELIRSNQLVEKLYRIERWALWNSDESSLSALCTFRQSINNPAAVPASFTITVAQNHRLKGIGNRMLGIVADCANRYNRVLLNCYTNNRFPAGESFIQKTGAIKIHETSFNRLQIVDVNRELLDKWLKLPESEHQAIKIGSWASAFPENRMDEICKFYQTVYDADNSQNITGFKYTREQLREVENASLANGKKLTVYAIDTMTDKLLGFTEVYSNLSRPSVLSQKYTAVLPCARNRGIGRRLKAEMLTRILKELPADVSIGTANASLNKAILSINNELGFKLHTLQKTWQIETELLIEFAKIHHS